MLGSIDHFHTNILSLENIVVNIIPGARWKSVEHGVEWSVACGVINNKHNGETAACEHLFAYSLSESSKVYTIRL